MPPGALFPEAPGERLPRWRTWPVEKWGTREFVGYFVAGLLARHRSPTVPIRGMEAHMKRLLLAAEERFGPHDGRRALRQLLDLCLDSPACTGTGYVLREAERFWSGNYSGLYRPPGEPVAEEAW